MTLQTTFITGRMASSMVRRRLHFHARDINLLKGKTTLPVSHQRSAVSTVRTPISDSGENLTLSFSDVGTLY